MGLIKKVRRHQSHHRNHRIAAVDDLVDGSAAAYPVVLRLELAVAAAAAVAGLGSGVAEYFDALPVAADLEAAADIAVVAIADHHLCYQAFAFQTLQSQWCIV